MSLFITQCSYSHLQVSLAEKYQQEKHAEEKSILVKQVDSLTDRHTKANKDLQETQVENARLLSQLKNTLGMSAMTMRLY